MSSFSVFDNLESGSDSVAFKKQASRNSIASAVHLAQRDFGQYLNNATDKVEFNERLAYVIGDISEIVERTASFEDIPEVIKVLTWNFDKKKDDDDDADSKDDDKDSDDAGSDDADDDSDSSDDDDDSDDDSTPDFVDTDKSDDKDRDDKKESRKQAESLPSEQEGFVGLLDDWPLEANPVSKDFEGDVNELEPAGFNAVGSTGFPIVARNVKANPQHLNPAAPNNEGFNWESNPWGPEENLMTGRPGGGDSNLGEVHPGYSEDDYYGDTQPFGHSTNPPYQQSIPPVNNVDEAKAEVEKTVPQIGAPGRHRASLPFVPRNASRPKA